MYFLGGSLAPLGLTVSFLARPTTEVCAALISWREKLAQTIQRTEPAPLPRCAEALDPLEAPWTVELLVDCGSWTAYLNNSIAGGDPTASAPHLSTLLDCDCIVAMQVPRYGPGHATIGLSLLGPRGAKPLRNIRTIRADMTDGRWSWRAEGEVQPFEKPARYDARLVRDRLDRPLLLEYLAALGIRADDPSFYGDGIAVRQIVAHVRRRETVAESKARLGLR